KKGAFFRIVVPDVWNGDLVIWNHGFSLSPIGPVSDLGPLAFPVQIPEGYAVAASSYSQIGWALFKTKKDNDKLIEIFIENFGVPGQILVNGASLGGIVTAQAVEELANEDSDANITGAFPFCGAVAGSRNWDGAIDLRLVYDFVCSGVPGAALPGGATGLPSPGFPDFPLTNTQMALAVHACTGILAPPPFRTPAQAANLAQILSATTLPESFLLTDMGFVTFGLSNVIWEKKKLKGKQGVGNANVVYPDPVIDAGIARVTAHNGGAKKLAKHFTPKGNVGAVKIVSMHTDGDGLVIVENEGNYRDVVPAANLTTAIVDEAGNSHCGFTEAELVAGWESLRGWVAGGPQPTAAGIQGLCGLIELGGAAGPCRIDPAFPLGVMSDRVPLR
ncbi:MAG: hypothetical protein ACE5FC_09145, partial [Myxococcota bacterium]